MRVHFTEQMNLLSAELTRMGGLCEKAILKSANSLLNSDPFLAHEVIYLDGEIDEKENEIVSLCYKLLLQQQPVVRSGHTKKFESKTSHIKEMARATIDMVNGAITAFVRRDLELAHAVIAYDDIVDDLFDTVRNDLVETISSTADPDGRQAIGETAIDLLMIAKYLERIGDHAVNIAEWVEFSITGKQKETR